MNFATDGASTGWFRTAAGTTNGFIGGNFYMNSGTVLSNAGATRVAGASVYLTSTVTNYGSFELAGGTLGGTGTLVSLDHFLWTGGSMANSGSTEIQPSGALTITGSDVKTLDTSHTLHNAGVAVWSGTGNLGLYNYATFTNNGTFDVQNDAGLVGNGTGGWFQNAGVFRKSAGNGTTTITVGFNNNGLLDVQSGIVQLFTTVTQDGEKTLLGGTWEVHTNATLVLGSGSGFAVNQGNVTLNGTNSTFARMDALADNRGSFNLFGGRVFNTARNLTNSGTLQVSGPASALRVNGDLIAGATSGANQITVSDGGSLFATNALLGSVVAATGTVSRGSLFVTNATATGTLEVRRGALEINSGTVVVDRLIATNSVSSVVNFNSGTLNSGSTMISNGTPFQVGNGSNTATLNFNGGTHTFSDGLMLSTNSSLIGSGGIFGSATNFGVIAPGHSAGMLTFSGDLTLNDSSLLSMEIGGTDTNAYDRVLVGGFLHIAGLLSVTLTNGYTASVGDTFDLFNFSSETGTFAQTNLPTLSSGMSWDTSKLYTLGEIGITGVPEPTTWALMLAGGCALWLRRRNR